MKTSALLTLALVALMALAQPAWAQAQAQRDALIRAELSDRQATELRNAENIVASADLIAQQLAAMALQYEQNLKTIESGRGREKRQARRENKQLDEQGAQKWEQCLRLYAQGYRAMTDLYKVRLEVFAEAMPTKRPELINAYSQLDREFQSANQRMAAWNSRTTLDRRQEGGKAAIGDMAEGIEALRQSFCLFINCKPDQISNEPWTIEPVRDEGLVVFQVQVVAVRQPLSQDQLQGITKGFLDVKYVFEDGLHKYSVGTFQFYDDARAFSEQVGGGAFVVAFQNGQKIPDILQAIQTAGQPLPQRP